MFRSTPGNTIWCGKQHSNLWGFIKCCLKCCLRAAFIPLACWRQAAASTWRRVFLSNILHNEKKDHGLDFKMLQYSVFSYHWFLCLCKTAAIFSHGGFWCFPPVFVSMWGRDQTRFYPIVKGRLPWKPRWIVQGSPSSGLRSETNLNLGRRSSELGGEQSWEVWLLTQPCCSCLGQVLLSPAQWSPPITTCWYSFFCHHSLVVKFL